MTERQRERVRETDRETDTPKDGGRKRGDMYTNWKDRRGLR